MQRTSWFHRCALPLATLVALRLAASLVYHTAGNLPPGGARTLLIEICGPLGFLTLWFGALVAVPWTFARGARFGERLLAAFANPLLWVATVLWQVAEQFHGVELLYFFLLPWTFGIVCVTCLEVALAETACRALQCRRTPTPVRVFTPALLLLLAGGTAGTWFGLIKGQQWVYLVVHHYAAHFVN